MVQVFRCFFWNRNLLLIIGNPQEEEQLRMCNHGGQPATMVGYAAGLHYDFEHHLSIFVCYFWDYQQIAALFIGRTRKVIRRLFGKQKIAILFQN